MRNNYSNLLNTYNLSSHIAVKLTIAQSVFLLYILQCQEYNNNSILDNDTNNVSFQNLRVNIFFRYLIQKRRRRRKKVTYHIC